LTCLPAAAQGVIDLIMPGANDDLRETVKAASLLIGSRKDTGRDGQDILAAARADYGRILGALYAQGYYSGVISIRLDGREAADIAPLDAPAAVDRIAIRVETGPVFRFGAARMRPYARGTKIPPAYGDTRIAYATAITDAAGAGIEGWRQLGHAKARVADQQITADHRRARIDAQILLEPGPRLRFGTMMATGYERMVPRRLHKIAGFPAGEVFDPDKAARVADRLRRSGVFRSVILREAEKPNPDGRLDFTLTVVEEAPRRIGFGAELSSFEGLSVNGYWLHRNLLGGGERLRFDAGIDGIGGQTGGEDYRVGIRIDRPATLTPDTVGFLQARAERKTEEDFNSDSLTLGLGFTHTFSDALTAEIGLEYASSDVTDATGRFRYRQASVPLSVTWDRRDSKLDATTGFYVAGTARPFLGFETTGDGARISALLPQLQPE
jgi:translocation and assembly module TamA